MLTWLRNLLDRIRGRPAKLPPATTSRPSRPETERPKDKPDDLKYGPDDLPEDLRHKPEDVRKREF